MNDQEILAAVIEAVSSETGYPPSDITLEMSASDIPGWDSLAHIRILLDVGGRLGLVIDIEKTYAAATIAELVPIIKQGDVAQT